MKIVLGFSFCCTFNGLLMFHCIQDLTNSQDEGTGEGQVEENVKSSSDDGSEDN
jgi:hypothetical protein